MNNSLLLPTLKRDTLKSTLNSSFPHATVYVERNSGGPSNAGAFDHRPGNAVLTRKSTEVSADKSRLQGLQRWLSHCHVTLLSCSMLRCFPCSRSFKLCLSDHWRDCSIGKTDRRQGPWKVRKNGHPQPGWVGVSRFGINIKKGKG